jgi:tagaturonate reductase
VTCPTPILQFGTGRFMQAHADLFVSEAMDRDEALGPVTVVQTTDSAASIARVAALAQGGGYPVRVRGLMGGRTVDLEVRSRSIRRALAAGRDWPEIRRVAVEEAEVILSNTSERGFALDPDDDGGVVADPGRVPRAYPAKLLALLFARWQARPDSPVSILPCELVRRNGDLLRGLVEGLAQSWGLPAPFRRFLTDECRWANTLVDRIVSEPIEPVGAVAEPYALWAVERQDGLRLPCRHNAIVMTDDLDRYERLKLHILNLGHTILAELWLRDPSPDTTVLQAMAAPALRERLEAAWAEEVLPVFAAEGLGAEAHLYRDEVRERFLNPFLAHRLADIAQNHEEKKRRRLTPIVAAAASRGLALPQRVLRAALGSEGGARSDPAYP